MNSGVSKAQPRRSRVRLSKRLQEELLSAIAIPSPAEAGLPRDGAATSTKRKLDAVNQPPAKKARLSNAHQTEVESEGVRPVDKTPALQHPKPKPPYASFLDEFVDPVQPCSEHSSLLEWLESVGSDRDTRCRSDSHLHPAGNKPSRQFTRSAPAMGYRRDADGFTVPPTPVSTGSRSCADTDDRSAAPSDVTGSTPSSSRRSLVEDPYYRRMNLATNNIYMQPLHSQFPEDIDDIIRLVQQDRDSPGPSLEDVRQDTELNELWMGAGSRKWKTTLERVSSRNLHHRRVLIAPTGNR